MCLHMAADGCCGACPEPPLTQPTILYPATLREATQNLGEASSLECTDEDDRTGKGKYGKRR